MSYFGATGTPVLDFWWRLLWVLKPEWFCLIRIAEANVMYISWDPPLVLHVAGLLTDSIAGRRPGSYLAQGYYCVAAVSLEPTINRSWVPRANHSATRPGGLKGGVVYLTPFAINVMGKTSRPGANTTHLPTTDTRTVRVLQKKDALSTGNIQILK